MSDSVVIDAPREQTVGVAQPRIYYGWVMIVMGAWAMTATFPGRTHGLGMITKPLTEDASLGVGKLLFSQLNFWAILLGSVLCLPVGKSIDRFGVRPVLVVVASALGLAVLSMSRANGALSLFLTLTLIRGHGQQALSVVSMAMIGKWFTRRLGMAMGIFTVLLTVGFVVTIVGVGEAVKAYEWRPVWAAIGICLIGGLALPGWLLVRSSPEAMGLAVEGATAATASRAALDVPLRSALKSPTFWAFTLAAAFFNFVWSAITLFNESLMTEQNFDHRTFELVMAAMAAGGLPANLLCGWLATRWPMGRLLAFGMALLAAALVAFPGLSATPHVVMYGAAMGIAGGIVTVIFFTAYGLAFGRKHLGAIQATVQVITVFASALGPLLLAQCKEQTGSYHGMFFIAAPVAAVLAVAAWFAKLPDSRGSLRDPALVRGANHDFQAEGE